MIGTRASDSPVQWGVPVHWKQMFMIKNHQDMKICGNFWKDVRFLYSPVERAPTPCVLAPCFWPPRKTIILFHCQSVWHFEKHLLWDSHCLCASEASNGLFICKQETHIYRWDSNKKVDLSVASGIRAHVERNRPTKASSLLLFCFGRKCWLLTLDSLTNWQCKFGDEGKQELATDHNVDIWYCKNGPSFYQCFH